MLNNEKFHVNKFLPTLFFFVNENQKKSLRSQGGEKFFPLNKIGQKIWKLIFSLNLINLPPINKKRLKNNVLDF